ncbi:hypothetical protein KAW48_02445 [candidate division WOR-3 bacterium]|nr:hypothetical protein [candidate division WOR-3 bacterium]
MDSMNKKELIDKIVLWISVFVLTVYFSVHLSIGSYKDSILFMLLILFFGFLVAGPFQILASKLFEKWLSTESYKNYREIYRLKKKHLLTGWIIIIFFAISAITILLIENIPQGVSIFLGFIASGIMGLWLGLMLTMKRILPEKETEVSKPRESEKENRIRIYGWLFLICGAISSITWVLLLFVNFQQVAFKLKPPFDEHPLDFIMIGNLILLICVFFIGLFLLLKSKGKSIELENPER